MFKYFYLVSIVLFTMLIKYISFRFNVNVRIRKVSDVKFYPSLNLYLILSVSKSNQTNNFDRSICKHFLIMTQIV